MQASPRWLLQRTRQGHREYVSVCKPRKAVSAGKVLKGSERGTERKTAVHRSKRRLLPLDLELGFKAGKDSTNENLKGYLAEAKTKKGGRLEGVRSDPVPL
jgi:hypothetical protein